MYNTFEMARFARQMRKERFPRNSRLLAMTTIWDMQIAYIAAMYPSQCKYCNEVLLPVDRLRQRTLMPYHVECLTRMVVGSAAHQLKKCACYGGEGHDPEGLTRREAARLAYETFFSGVVSMGKYVN